MPTFLQRLASDRAGNTLALMAAAIFPLMAMVGGGVDMGRSYLSQSRLQQACDAGVLAARKRLGTEAAITGSIPTDAAATGQRFFNMNFRDGAYGTQDRTFAMTLTEDFGISGQAAVIVPTAVMHMFGYDQVPVEVTCNAQLNASNTDIMMVLDVTGSMDATNPGDTAPRIEAMRGTIKSFYQQMNAAVGSSTRLRFGFVPYSTNVNVGHLLQDSWVVDDWSYQSRETTLSKNISTRTYYRNWSQVSGTRSEVIEVENYPATLHEGTAVDEGEGGGIGTEDYYSCDTPAPADDLDRTDELLDTATYAFVGPPAGVQTVESRRRTDTGTDYWLSRVGETCLIRKRVSDNYVETYEKVTEPFEQTARNYTYDQLELDVRDWRSTSNGCVEERETYEIDDYGAVDLSRALDLDLDMVPTSDNATRWRPMFPDIIFARQMEYDGTGDFDTRKKVTEDEYVNPETIGLASCPAEAKKLSVMSEGELTTYLNSLTPVGQTYHDTGMIWGGRLISPTGLFAAENADVSSSLPSTRHLIFLTDGETEPYDLGYSSYGMEPLDQRRWNESSPLSLRDTVEARFAFACDEVKRKNVTVWVVAFGTTLNPVFQDCAGSGHYFEAADADELNDTFAKIAGSLAELRITN
ncbi:TadE/TadG family type IV pilus assembly protein [Altererythrobacter sp. ZODW24]|uniref:TadE/TadG family type IV pilus assembly protein n=1 Tax=Altererythrobacter sp. ZODW24 TaxID=2185142 RepID=UPI0013B3DD83|nr:TadE/TadG family type IV pilus assembly protein [Altererythrobacter sp. ZODW24]